VPQDEPDLNERLRAGSAVAATLVGLTAAQASDRVEASGFVPQVIPTGHLVTADVAPRRIRLVVDESGVVTRAWAG
jgi:Potato inhibitor I family